MTVSEKYNSNLIHILNRVRNSVEMGKNVVFTNGCFDLFHVGHLDFLNKCKKCGDFLFVGINSDLSIKRIKGLSRPIIPEEQRLSIVRAIKWVDEAVLFDEDTPLELIKKIQPSILIKGGDWKIDNIVGREFVESYGGEVFIIPHEINISTSNIIQKIIRNLETIE